MSTVTKELQNVEKKVEEGVVETAKKAKEVLANVASHLPFANLSRNRKNETLSVEVYLPGVKKEDIDVSVENDHLQVTGVRRLKEETKKEDYYLMESTYGKFVRSFFLPEEINRESIEAVYKDGCLKITFEKVPAKKRRDIAVK